MTGCSTATATPRATRGWCRTAARCLPTGGLDHGQKGYGMALHAEALTQGLAGYGRADAPEGTNAAVTVQVWDPEAFGGREAFLRQTGWLADTCRANPPRPGVSAVRLPGQAALARRRAALTDGMALHPGIIESLAAARSPPRRAHFLAR